MAARRPSSRVWVLPNRHALGLAAVLVAMWYAGASQSNGAAYLLCFVLTALAAVAAVHTWANLRGVHLAAQAIQPAFAGDELIVTLLATSERNATHFAIQVTARQAHTPVRYSEVSPSRAPREPLLVPVGKRGRFSELHLRLTSLYPLGFCTAFRAAVLEQTYYVYPKPTGALPLPRSLAPTRQPRGGQRRIGEDFGGVRAWRPGESQRHIDWKAAARGQPLLVKQWTGEADEILHFDWHALPALGGEERLSQLAQWIVLAERGSASYGLRIPGREIAPARGEPHYHECLRALASFAPDV